MWIKVYAGLPAAARRRAWGNACYDSDDARHPKNRDLVSTSTFRITASNRVLADRGGASDQ
jgi:hypothetical protein